MNIISKFINWQSGLHLTDFVKCDLYKTACNELWIELPTGYKIYAHIHSPIGRGRYPGIIIVPGADSPGTDYDKGLGLRAEDLASCGFSVLHYDPSGRGKTDGKEDHWGYIHQQELSYVIDYFTKLPIVMNDNVGILSFSIGIIIASGAQARFPASSIKYIFDWEGPSNRFNTTKNNTHKPLKNFPTSREDFWNDREAARFISEIRCGYFRYQAEIDHVQGNYKGHTVELLNKATKGKAAWTQCNDNPVNILFDENKIQEYNWVSSRLNHKGQILKYLLELQKERFV